jgi:hypothetical protein
LNSTQNSPKRLEHEGAVDETTSEPNKHLPARPRSIQEIAYRSTVFLYTSVLAPFAADPPECAYRELLTESLQIASILNNPAIKMPGCMPQHRHHDGETGEHR